MPHPSDFENHLPATTDTERKRFWASVPAEAMIATVRLRAEDHGAAPWLRSLMDMGGLCFPRTFDGFRITGLPPGRADDEAFVPKNFHRIDAVARMSNMTRIEDVNTGEVGGPTVNVIRTDGIGEDWRTFHADFCKMLVADDLAWRVEAMGEGHSLEKINESEHAKSVRNTLGVALATACILNNAESVATIARHDPETMKVAMSLDALGKWGAMDMSSNKVERPKVTPYFCAMQCSAGDAMDALIDAGLDPKLTMGMAPNRRGMNLVDKPFDVLSLGKVFSPACEPGIYEKALQQRLATADIKTLQRFTSDAIDVLSSSESEDKIIFKYLPSLIKAGAFDRDPDGAAAEACIYGIPSVLQHVLPNVDWRTHVTDLASGDSPIYKATHNMFTSDRKEAYDAAMETFFRGAAGAGFDQSALRQTVQNFGGDTGLVEVAQPIHNLVKLDARRTINAMLQKGLDPHMRIKDGLETPMEIAVRMDNGVDDLMRTALARSVANAALADLDAEMDASRPTKRVAP